ncbi:hypothetical protein BZA70DRAFT_281865 [Myxozyma melibiosi]|uniref:DUF1446 domain-containing protein n=1 Tax=Myxozyma melibiosi TaxID=54550 RepID=A0ABR1F318_9ASCO
MTISPRGQKRSIRIANCSGAMSDEGAFMYKQCTEGPIDAVTGDYLAEVNIAANSQAYRAGTHPGWEPTAEEGLMLSLDVIAEKGIKVVINGGSLNPKGLAEKVHSTAVERGLDLKISYVTGDDFYDQVDSLLTPERHLAHFDSANHDVKLAKDTDDFLNDPNRVIVSANAYIGARGIVAALRADADIVICGRVADASPVIGLAMWWHGWSEKDYDFLAHSLLAGHLIECSGYATGANFADFDRYRPQEKLVDLGYPIAEISSDGTFVITKHETLNGIVNLDTARAQLLYELQGNLYLNSDVTADLANVEIKEIGKNRVEFSGVKGLPPPPTTKLAIFYVGGFQCEGMIVATGRNSTAKFDLLKLQITRALEILGTKDQLDILDFQEYAHAEPNPHDQKAGSSFMRLFAQAKTAAVAGSLGRALYKFGMQHFSGMHSTMDYRTFIPKQFLAYYPSLLPQSDITESAVIIGKNGEKDIVIPAGNISESISLSRDSYETSNPVDLATFGETVYTAMDEVVLGRSGDKGANVNIGLFVHEDDEWDWLRTYFTGDLMKRLVGDDWKDEYYLERVEFPHLKAVHFVIYGILGRGVSSSVLLDCLGKGFADYIRSKYVDVPKKFLARYEGKTILIE